jgi:hypothetical protein
MKVTTLFALLFALLPGQSAFAQKKLPIIRANSTSVDIKEDDQLTNNAWQIVPEVELDVFTTSAKRVTFTQTWNLFLLKLIPKNNTTLLFCSTEKILREHR